MFVEEREKNLFCIVWCGTVVTVLQYSSVVFRLSHARPA